MSIMTKSKKRVGRPRIPKTEKLLREIERRGEMTHVQMIGFIAGMMGGKRKLKSHGVRTGSLWNAQLYGTSDRVGILERFCGQDIDTRKYFRNGKKVRRPYYIRRKGTEFESMSPPAQV
jgi:hypothetical protein